MSSKRPNALVRAALAAGLVLPAAALLPIAASALASPAHAAGQAAPTIADMKQVLQAYGRFVAHDRYGEVWLPDVAPQGWHPYGPCRWTYTQRLGWYYDDPTPWGRIVHHYGRWAHDASLGWVWVAGEEFSPGWVVWRAGEQFTGWAPMPPQVDVQAISAEAFNSDKHWIFVETPKLGSKCDGAAPVMAASSVPTLIHQTKVVTQVRFVEGIGIFVLPPPVVISVVDVNIGVFAPWSPTFIGNVFWAWNWIWNNVTVIVTVNNTCPVPEKPKLIAPIKSEPPPPPGKKAQGPQPKPELPPVLVAEPVRPPRPVVVVDQARPVLPRRPVVGQGGYRPPPVELADILPRQPGRIVHPRPERPAVERPIVERPQRPVRVVDPGFTRPRPLPRRPVVQEIRRPQHATFRPHGGMSTGSVSRVPVRQGPTMGGAVRFRGGPDRVF